MKTLQTGPSTLQPVPGGATTGLAQPLPPDGTLPGALTTSTTKYVAAQAAIGDGLTKNRSHNNAPLAGRIPVQATRSQDRRPDSNDGVTITAENGQPVAAVGSTLR